MFTVYILRSLNYKKTYVGYTNNLGKRLSEHNSGKSKYTSRFKPWKLIHQETFEGLKQAVSREKYYKSCAGRKKLKLLIDDYSEIV